MTLTHQEILNLPIEDTNTDAKTLGQYLFQLLESLILEGEGFDTYAPLGKEEWVDPVRHTLILNQVLDGTLDEYGRIDDFNAVQFNGTMLNLSTFLQKADYSTLQLPPAPKDHHLIEKGDFGSYSNIILGYEEDALSEEEAKTEAAKRNASQNYEGTWYAIKIS